MRSTFYSKNFMGDEDTCKMIEFTMYSIAKQSGWDITREIVEPTEDIPIPEKE